MAAADKRRRVIFIGASMAGKTTLTQAMMREELRYRKTQTLDIVGGFIIDTPGEYLERGGMRGALSVAAAEARLIVFLQSASAAQSFFPPSFASMFGKPVAGVVTKADIASPEEIAEAKRRLTRAGVGRIFVTSAYTGEGIQEFVDFIDSLEK
ncbi:EutP/PduV family microcompartment system protein [Cloacibacillus sp.]|uniref:EutP/PduV family microcompartment system protein n=1 Tax=Cloacibacillus sp. TaxID=2049023 RepID=UPI0025C50963|nr:EutP/PduV family microcompartment system protein [Cloacibacillus sp.]MCC8056684.1 EutP/PduV family microcompartment system protein [Cloacibacillus sp.]